MTVRWRRAGEPEHALLRGGQIRLEVAALTATEAPNWADPATGRPCATGPASGVAASFTVPDTAAALRLTFSVRLAAGGQDEEALAVAQRLTVAGPGSLVADAYQLPRFALQTRRRGGGAEVLQDVPTRQPTTVPRRFLGHHPLLQVAKDGTVEIDTEFLDATNLWWALHWRACPNNTETDFNPWYLEPACNDRPGRLRVLLNTRVTPMLWFATLPPERDLPDGTTVGGYVFFRPIGSSYPYPATWPGVLAEPAHATKGMRNLCRYVLRGHNRAGQSLITGLPDWHQLLDHAVNPTLPLNSYGFLPCGMEHALDRTAPKLVAQAKELRLLLLPVPDQHSPNSHYGGNAGPGNAARVSAAVRLLWSRGAFGGPGQQLLRTGEAAPPVPPQPGLTAPSASTLRVAADAWAGAYSSGGHALWTFLDDPGNRSTTSRVLVFDTVRFDTGKERLLATAKARGRGLSVRIVWSPYAMGRAPAPDFLAALRGSGAGATVWPTAGDAYFRAPPNPDNAWAEYVFAGSRPWSAAMFPAGRLAEWWHQFVVFGGEKLLGDPRDPRSVTFMEATMEP